MTTANYNHSSSGKSGDSSCKICYFINVYTTSLLKLSLFSPLRYLWVNDYKSKDISGCACYIFKCNVRHRLHCLVLTDTYL